MGSLRFYAVGPGNVPDLLKPTEMNVTELPKLSQVVKSVGKLCTDHFQGLRNRLPFFNDDRDDKKINCMEKYTP